MTAALTLAGLPARGVAQYCPWAYRINAYQMQNYAMTVANANAAMNAAALANTQMAQWDQVMPRSAVGMRAQAMQRGQFTFNMPVTQYSQRTNQFTSARVSLAMERLFFTNLYPNGRDYYIWMLTRGVAKVTWSQQQVTTKQQQTTSRPVTVTMGQQGFTTRPASVTGPQASLTTKQQQLTVPRQQVTSKQQCIMTPQTRTVYQVTLNASCNKCHTPGQSPNLIAKGPPAPLTLPGPGHTPNLLPGGGPIPALLARGNPLRSPLAGRPMPPALPRSAPVTLPLPSAPPPLPAMLAQGPSPLPWLPALPLPTALPRPQTSDESLMKSTGAPAQPPALMDPVSKPAETRPELKELPPLPEMIARPSVLATLPDTVLQIPVSDSPAAPNPDARAAYNGEGAPAVEEPGPRMVRVRQDLLVPDLALPDTVLRLPEMPDADAPAEAEEPEEPAEAAPPLPALAVQPPVVPGLPETVLQPPAPGTSPRPS
jgi:hypothetical protein